MHSEHRESENMVRVPWRRRNRTEQDNEVRFHWKHRAILWQDNLLKTDTRTKVRYRFIGQNPVQVRSNLESFQNAIRGRLLVGGRFECDEISSARGVDARNEQLKIWKTA